MNSNKTSWYVFTVGVLLISFMLILILGLSVGSNLMGDSVLMFSSYFMFDTLSWFLSILVLIICFLTMCSFEKINKLNYFLLLMSCFFSILCFSSSHCILFWVFYELSIICILFLLYTDSPYSDRYMAGWYFTSYAIFGGLPMLLVLVYNGLEEGTFFFVSWSNTNNFCVILLLLLFITKIPLIPFHAWLPIVHAEASTITSVCLSGYIMKLGLAGLIRFGVYNIEINGFIHYYLLSVLVSTIFIFLTCLEEVDFKRWLAMLSLSHIGVGVLCLYSCFINNLESSLVFGLGHGIAASYFFLLVMLVGLAGGSRSVNTISLISGWGMSIVWLLIVGFCLAASFPPFINFFIEVWLVGSFSGCLVWYSLLLVYLFFSSLIPLSVLGLSLTRRNNSNTSQNDLNNYVLYFFLFYIGCIVSLV